MLYKIYKNEVQHNKKRYSSPCLSSRPRPVRVRLFHLPTFVSVSMHAATKTCHTNWHYTVTKILANKIVITTFTGTSEILE